MNLPSVHGSSLTKCARWIIITAHLYYDRGVSIIDDEDFDQLCMDVADVRGELPPQLRWQLGRASDLRATGMGIKVTQRGVAAAERLARDLGHDPIPYTFRPAGVSKRYGCMWSPIRS